MRSPQAPASNSPSHAAMWRANNGASFDSNTSNVAPGRGLISKSQIASSSARKSTLLRPTRSNSEAILATQRAISAACAGSTSMGPAAPPYRNGDPGAGAVHCVLRPMISTFLPAREEQSRDAVSANAPLKIRIRPSASRGLRDSDMIATSPASLFHEPEPGLIRRRERDLRMSNAVCIANPREDKRILCALQRFGVVAEHSYSAGYGRDGFWLMFETCAIDEPNRFMDAD